MGRTSKSQHESISTRQGRQRGQARAFNRSRRIHFIGETLTVSLELKKNLRPSRASDQPIRFNPTNYGGFDIEKASETEAAMFYQFQELGFIGKP